MIKSIEKDKIPKQYSFVLKTKQLEDLIITNDISIHIDLRYVYWQSIGSIFEAEFRLPNNNIPYNRLYIRAGALPNEYVFAARKEMEEIILPEFKIWITNIINLPNNSTHILNKPYFNAIFENNKLQIIKQPRYKRRI